MSICWLSVSKCKSDFTSYTTESASSAASTELYSICVSFTVAIIFPLEFIISLYLCRVFFYFASVIDKSAAETIYFRVCDVPSGRPTVVRPFRHSVSVRPPVCPLTPIPPDAISRDGFQWNLAYTVVVWVRIASKLFKARGQRSRSSPDRIL